MAINQAVDRSAMSAAQAQLARVESEGCVDHSYRCALLSARRPCGQSRPCRCRSISSVRFTAATRPNRIALNNCPAGQVRDWLREASDAYERERLYLVRLTASVGPLPSTPGAAETEAALVRPAPCDRTLAKSERRGCALGAATALMATGRLCVLSWTAPPTASAFRSRR
jgi:hypothetical protein